MKGPHDYRFRGYLKFMIYCIAWIIFLLGIIQLKFYLLGKNTLPFISIIYCGIIGYVLYLISVTYGFNVEFLETGAFTKALALILTSLIVLIFSWSGYVKKIHLQSKNNIFRNSTN
jgi:hypothetical protein